jgi:hypothetical protein
MLCLSVVCSYYLVSCWKVKKTWLASVLLLRRVHIMGLQGGFFLVGSQKA